RLFPQPYHTSTRTGQMWIDELLSGHPDRIRRNLGMHRFVFRKLARVLSAKTGIGNSKHVSLDEALGIFLH
ncbi:hypothetical protein C8R46DRAFT_845136, partial [Mycena filopes]